jgi:DNA-binding IclR family transcriptional regulator
MRLVDVQQQLQLTRPTAHRLLLALVRRRFVEHDEQTRRYRLGPESAMLSWSVLNWQTDLRDLCHQDLEILAQDTSDTSHLVVRSGYDSLCIDRCMGSFPVRVFTVELGARRPLGVGASGLALLSALPPAEAEDILQTVASRLVPYSPLTEDSIAAAVAAARARGYALSEGYGAAGVRGVAIPFFSPRGSLVGSLSIAAVADRIPPSRVEHIVAALVRRRSTIERRVAQPPASIAGRQR